MILLWEHAGYNITAHLCLYYYNSASQKWSRISCLAASLGVWVPLTANSVWPLYTVLQVRTELWCYSCSRGLLFLAWVQGSLYFLVTFTCLPVFHVCFFVRLQMWLSSSLFLERRCNHRSSAVINHSNTFASSSTWTVMKSRCCATHIKKYAGTFFLPPPNHADNRGTYVAYCLINNYDVITELLHYRARISMMWLIRFAIHHNSQVLASKMTTVTLSTLWVKTH